MTYFLNAFAASLMSVAFFSYGLYVRDMNRLPYCRRRAALAWVASAIHLAVCVAWIVNGYHGGQTDFGRFVQTWQWIGRATGGLVISWTVALGYRQSAADRARIRELQHRVGG